MIEQITEAPEGRRDNHVSGTIIALQGDVLSGWALDRTHPEDAVVIEVLIDDVGVSVVRADQYEPAAPLEAQLNGFAVQLRQTWLDGAKTISARVANRHICLDGKILLPDCREATPSEITSQVWHTGGLGLSGWAWDPKAPSRHVHIIVKEGAVEICRQVCNLPSPALIYRDTSDHGFTIELPWHLADGNVHRLEVINEAGQPLAGSPITVTCWPEGPEVLISQLNQTSDPRVLQLLARVVKDQSVRLPKSAGWSTYPEWHNAFHDLTMREEPVSEGKVGLLLITDGNPDLENRSLESLQASNGRLSLVVSSLAQDVYPAITTLLEAGCDKILPVHAGDRLAPHALGHLCALLKDHVSWAYADCDHDSPEGHRSQPWFKPTWDLDWFIGTDIFTPGAIFSARILDRALALTGPACDGKTLNWHSLIAAIALATEQDDGHVVHLPSVLYHRSADKTSQPEYNVVSEARKHAMDWLCQKLAPGASTFAVPGFPALLRAHWPLPDCLPRVSLIVPTKDQYMLLRTCIEGLLCNTDYPDLEVIVVDNQSSDAQTLAYLATLPARGVVVISHPYPFNYSTINNRAVREASGEIIGLVNNDIEIIDSGWLKEMVAQVLRPGVGIVGAKLLWPNRMVQHAGVVVGINGLAAHVGNHWNEQDAGYLGLNQVARHQSAITAACLIMTKQLFWEVDGLDPQAFPVAFNDVDLCLKVRASGKTIIWTPQAQLIHAESASRGKDGTAEKKARAAREQRHFMEKWSDVCLCDPFYSPSLSLDYLSGPYGALALPPKNLMKSRVSVKPFKKLDPVAKAKELL